MGIFFPDTVAVVTGASRGLGYSTALALAARGAHVVACARTVGGLEELDDEIKAAGGEATLSPFDLRDDPAIERLGAAVFDRWGRIDVFVNCAVNGPTRAPVEHVEAKEVDETLAVNVRAVQRMIRSFDSLLKAAPAGRAVFCEDDRVGEKFYSAYAASKAGAAAYARAWAAETANTPLKILRVVPPPMPTTLRGRFYPGETRDHLTPTATVASRIVDILVADSYVSGARVSLAD